ncbi:MAG: hypothetical protein DME44_00880 [Verrucomicrobia bacterium]|nr:MAG: hypothetical protein DME44_00880 [Verrucomicrobiota bacterium]
MSALALLGAFGTLLFAGYGLLTLLIRQQTRFSLTEQIAFSWLLGAGAVSLLLWIFGLFVHGVLLPRLVAIVCLALGFVGWRRMVPRPLRRRATSFEILLGIIIVIEIAVVFYLSFVHTLGWDGLLNWEIKARYAFANGGILPGTYFSDSGRAFSHPEYPLAIPFTELWLYFWLGEADQFCAKTIFPIFYVVGIFLLIALGKRLAGREWIGLLVAPFLFFVPQITVEVGSAIAGYADFPLSVFYLATIGCLFCAAEQGNAAFFRLYAACLALLPWVKRDGVILWTVAAACGVFVILRTKRSPLFFLGLLPGLLVICGWHIYLSTMHALRPADFLPVNLETLGSHLYRIPPLLSAFLAEFYNLPTWSLFWFVVAIGVAHLSRRMGNPRVLVLLAALIVPIFLYLLIYVFSSWPSYLDHVGLSISRLLMHVAPVGFLVTILAVSSRSEKNPARGREGRGVTCVTAGSERTPVVELA